MGRRSRKKGGGATKRHQSALSASVGGNNAHSQQADGLQAEGCEQQQQQQQADDEPKRGFSFVPFLIIMICQWAWRYCMNRSYITCLPEQEIVVQTEDYLLLDEFQELQRYLSQHPLLEGVSESALYDGNFAKTRGFVVKFNLEGAERLQSHEYTRELAPYFGYVKSRKANAFVLHVLTCPPSLYDIYPSGDSRMDGGHIYDDLDEFEFDVTPEENDELQESAEPIYTGESVVGIHLDDTVGIGPHWILPRPLDWVFLAHQVNVLYVNVPNDMVGGELDLWPHMGGRKPTNDTAPFASVVPRENLMAEFRGDAFHRVRAYNTDGQDNKMRVSLVLEQYIIPDSHYERTVEFDLVQDGDHRQYP